MSDESLIAPELVYYGDPLSRPTGFSLLRDPYRLNITDSSVTGTKAYVRDGGELELPELGDAFDTEHPHVRAERYEVTIERNSKSRQVWTVVYSSDSSESLTRQSGLMICGRIGSSAKKQSRSRL